MASQESYVRTLKAEAQNWLADAAETSSLTPIDSRARLQRQATSADAASTLEISLALVWRELIHGSCRVVDSFFTDERCYLVLSSPGATTPLPQRRLEILVAVLCGAGQKNVAIDLRLAPSTIALNARLGLESLGLRCKASRVHPLLMMAATADVKQDGTLAASLSLIVAQGEPLRVISVPRPDRRLFRVLPPAELAVIRYLVEGLPYQEIARLRGTSTRTIANQITAVFRRMRVSGRSELLSRLFFAEGMERALPPKPIDVPDPTSRRRANTAAALRSA